MSQDEGLLPLLGLDPVQLGPEPPQLPAGILRVELGLVVVVEVVVQDQDLDLQTVKSITLESTQLSWVCINSCFTCDESGFHQLTKSIWNRLSALARF